MEAALKNYTLGPEGDAWNEVARLDKPRSEIERNWERYCWRTLLPSLDRTELVVFGFIKSRTLDWQKYAEAIPMTVFRNGIRDVYDEPRLDPSGLPYCSGTGLSKEDTVRAAVQRLEQRQLITVIHGRSGCVPACNIYMPFSRGKLAEMLVDADGILPDCFPHLVIGEAVLFEDRFCRVEEHSADRVEIRPISLNSKSADVRTAHRKAVRRPSVEERGAYQRILTEERNRLRRITCRAA